MGGSCRYDVIIRLVLLKHFPHTFDIITSVTPVSSSIQIPDRKTVLQAKRDPGTGVCYLSSDKFQSSERGLMVEKHALAGEDAVSFSVDSRRPVRIQLGDRVGTPRLKGRRFILDYWRRVAIQLAGRCLI